MQLMKKTVAATVVAVVAGLFSLSAMASIAAPENGREYHTLAQPQQTDAVGKVEVIEFFFYSCPHCNLFDPIITEWVKKQGNSISFKRIHVDFGQGQQPLQRMYYTLEAMGKTEEFHSKIFSAIHKEHIILRNDDDMLNFVTKHGVDKTKYLEMSTSFSIESKMRRATQVQTAYKVDGVPMLAVDGHYVTAPSQVTDSNPGMTELQGAQSVLKVLDALVLKVQKERGMGKK